MTISKKFRDTVVSTDPCPQMPYHKTPFSTLMGSYSFLKDKGRYFMIDWGCV